MAAAIFGSVRSSFFQRELGFVGRIVAIANQGKAAQITLVAVVIIGGVAASYGAWCLGSLVYGALPIYGSLPLLTLGVLGCVALLEHFRFFHEIKNEVAMNKFEEQWTTCVGGPDAAKALPRFAKNSGRLTPADFAQGPILVKRGDLGDAVVGLMVRKKQPSDQDGPKIYTLFCYAPFRGDTWGSHPHLYLHDGWLTLPEKLAPLLEVVSKLKNGTHPTLELGS